jgi:transposase-like protein
LVLSLNVRRRHLTTEQKRAFIAASLKQAPEKSDRAIARDVGASPSTVGAVREELEDVSKLDTPPTHTDTKGRKQPARKPRAKPPAAPSRAVHDPAVKKLVREVKKQQEQREEILSALQPGEAGTTVLGQLIDELQASIKATRSQRKRLTTMRRVAK